LVSMLRICFIFGFGIKLVAFVIIVVK